MHNFVQDIGFNNSVHLMAKTLERQFETRVTSGVLFRLFDIVEVIQGYCIHSSEADSIIGY